MCQRSLCRAGWLAGLLFITVKAVALDPALTVFQYNCRSWARQNGLPANGVNAIVQTRDGYLWLGTSKGLVRFNGVEFNSVDMASAPQIRSFAIRGLSASQQGGLWFGLDRSGFGYLDEMEISFRGREDWGGLHLNMHWPLETRAGDLWLTSESMAARVTPDNQYQVVLPLTTNGEFCDATSICEGANGRIWLGTARRGLYFWQKGTTTKFPDEAVEKLIVRSLVEDRRGRIWVGTEMGLLCYDRNFQRQPLSYPWYETLALVEDKAGTIWAGTSGGGLVHFRHGWPTHFRKTDGLADDFVTALYEDQEGSLWIGTRNGLNQLSDVKIPTYGAAEGFGEVDVSVCASRRGGLWIGTAGGLLYYDGTNAFTNLITGGLLNRYTKTVFESRNGDLYLINGINDIEIISDGVLVARHANTDWPTALAEDDESVLVTVGGKLYRVGRDFFKPYHNAGTAPPSFGWVFNMIHARDGSLWVAGSDGLFRLKQGRWRAFKSEDGLADTKVTWVCEDREGNIWAGTEAGISRIKNGSVRTITREAGLADNFVVAMVIDGRDNMWVDSGWGFFKATLDELNAFMERRTVRVTCQVFDGEDAVKSADKNQQQPSGCLTADGRIWFPTAYGVVAINPTNMTFNPIPPRVHIDTVRANGVELKPKGLVRVEPGRGELEIAYAGLSFIAPQKVRFRYRLEGYDPDWVEAGGRRSAFYTNLKPGAYRFWVQACNEDGVWNTEGESYALELRPHYYEAGWFKILAGVLTFVLLSLIYGWRMQHLKWRQQRLQRANDLLEAKVNERTAELRRSNASLQNEIEERKRMELEVERVHRQLVDASRQAGQAEVASSVLHNVGNVLNSLNISTSVISDRLRELGLDKLTKATRLLEDHSVDPGRFLGEHEKGRLLPKYLAELSRHLTREQEDLLLEMRSLGENVDHIKEIVAMQQSYTKAFGVRESSSLQELVESALKMQGAPYRRHAIKLVREFEAVPPVLVERHKVLQILVNLLHNAKDACDESGRTDKRVAIRIAPAGGDSVSVSVIDNGIGIRADHLARIFSQGFTTKKHGHGFGLHSAALAAKELGGELAVSSNGPGWGACFTLTLPLALKEQTTTDSDLASLQALRFGGGVGEDGIPLESRPASIQLDSPQCSIRSSGGVDL